MKFLSAPIFATQGGASEPPATPFSVYIYGDTLKWVDSGAARKTVAALENENSWKANQFISTANSGYNPGLGFVNSDPTDSNKTREMDILLTASSLLKIYDSVQTLFEVTPTGVVNALGLSVTGAISGASLTITGIGGITAGGAIAAGTELSATGGVSAGSNITAGNAITATGAVNGLSDIQYNYRSISRGLYAPAKTLTATSATTSASTTVVDLAGFSVTASAVPANRTLRILVTGQIQSTVANDRAVVYVREGTTQLQAVPIALPLAATPVQVFVKVSLTPTAGNHTYKVSIARASGTGTVSYVASASSPAQLTVEDTGPST